MSQNPSTLVPDNTAVRVALWRAMHVQLDASPHVLEDEVGLRLAAPAEGWRQRPDMDPQFTRGFRAWIVARARFIEDLVIEESKSRVMQYVIVGAGLDTFAQRQPKILSRLKIFEIDKPDTQAWKRQRLIELGFGTSDSLRFVPVDFEKGEAWPEQLSLAGFNSTQPAIVASTGVSMYLTREANLATLRSIAAFGPGTTLAMTFQLPVEFVAEEDRLGREISMKGARASGTPFISFFAPSEMLELAREAGFKTVQHVSGTELTRRYFSGRSDGLRPSSGEDFLVATT